PLAPLAVTWRHPTWVLRRPQGRRARYYAFPGPWSWSWRFCSSREQYCRPQLHGSGTHSSRPFSIPMTQHDLPPSPAPSAPSTQIRVAATSFMSLFAIVGLALYGLPFFYDFMVRDFGWSRAQVTSGNALSKLVVGPLLGFTAGWFVDRFGPRRLLIAGILLAGTALIGLGSMHTLTGFYFFYLLNA